MKPIDFDERYAEYAEKWVRANMKNFKTIDLMEAQLPEVYLRWLNQKADFLGGLTPAEYFAKFTSAQELLALLRDYVDQKVDVPDLLLERVVDLGEESIAPLMALAADAGQEEELRVIALNLLIELGAEQAMELCLELVDNRAAHDDVADVAAELLESLGARAVPQMQRRLRNAGDEAMITYLDLLSNYPGDPYVYECAVAQFLKQPERRALLASYLGKIGDERAIEALTKALNLSDLNYLDYIEIVNAIERLGGEVDSTRSFDGDPYYESLKQMQ